MVAEGLPEPLGVLARVAAVLTRLDVPYFVAGSLASSLHGEPRSTNHIDLVADLDARRAEALVADVGADFYLDPAAVREHRSAWRLSPRAKRAGIIAPALVVLVVLLPWPLAVTGRFVTDPALQVSLVAPSGGTVEQVYATEGTRLVAGAPVARLRDFALEREAADLERLADSLEARAAAARAAGSAQASRELETERSVYASGLAGVRDRLGTLLVRTPAAGRLATPRLEETVGRWYEPGAVIARVVDDDSLDVRVRLDRAGSALVRPGQAARVISYADVGEPLRAVVTSVATAAAGPGASGAIEARVHVRSGGGWRPGTTGEARITVGRGSVARALWWGIRKRLRSDLLL